MATIYPRQSDFEAWLTSEACSGPRCQPEDGNRCLSVCRFDEGHIPLTVGKKRSNEHVHDVRVATVGVLLFVDNQDPDEASVFLRYNLLVDLEHRQRECREGSRGLSFCVTSQRTLDLAPHVVVARPYDGRW